MEDADDKLKHGGARAGAGRKPLDLDTDAISEMRFEGLSKREIARRLSVSYDTVLKYFKSQKETTI